MSDEYFTPQHVAGTRAGAEGWQAMSKTLVKYVSWGDCHNAETEELVTTRGPFYLASAADAALAELEQTIVVHADVLAETIHKHEQQLAEVTRDKQDMIWERDDLLKQLALKARRLAVVEETMKNIIEMLDGPRGREDFVRGQVIAKCEAALAGADASEQLKKETP